MYTRVNFWGDLDTINDVVEEIKDTSPERRAIWVQERVVSNVPRGGETYLSRAGHRGTGPGGPPEACDGVRAPWA